MSYTNTDSVIRNVICEVLQGYILDPLQCILYVNNIIGSDMNGHVGRDADGYGGVHGGMRFGTRNAEGERILEFGDAVGMVVCHTFFKKEDSKIIAYQSGDNRSMIDYLMVRKADRCLVKDVKVISSEECVPQHRMVIGKLVIPMKPQKKKIV